MGDKLKLWCMLLGAWLIGALTTAFVVWGFLTMQVPSS